MTEARDIRRFYAASAVLIIVGWLVPQTPFEYWYLVILGGVSGWFLGRYAASRQIELSWFSHRMVLMIAGIAYFIYAFQRPEAFGLIWKYVNYMGAAYMTYWMSYEIITRFNNKG